MEKIYNEIDFYRKNIKTKIYTKKFHLFFIWFAVLAIPSITNGQNKFIPSQELFPNQIKFQILYEDLGTELKNYDEVKQHVSKYFKIVREEPASFGKKGQYIELEDPSITSKNVTILLHFNEYRYDKFIVKYPQDDYLELFGVPWTEEKEAVKTIRNLYNKKSYNNRTHNFESNNKLEIKHYHNDYNLTFELEVIYTGYSVIHQNIASLDRGTVEPIKYNIASFTFPENKDFLWMGNQLGRQDKLELYYDFLPFLDDIKESENQISGTYVHDKNINVIISRPSKEENWNTLKIVSALTPNEGSKFHLFKSTWEKECEYANKTQEFKSIDCQNEKHTFIFSEYRTIIHTKNATNEAIEINLINSLDKDFAYKYYKKYTLPSSGKEILYKGRTNENGIPDGKILVYGNSLLELTVKDGKVINDPKTPYNIYYYRGELDPLTWEPKGEGKYKYEIVRGLGENKTKSAIIYSGTFDENKTPDLAKPLYIIMQGDQLPYKGTFKLINPVEIQIKNYFSYEGKAIYIPEDMQDDRYIGSFAMVFDGSTMRSYPYGEHIHEHFSNNKWSFVEKTFYDIIYGKVEGKNFYKDNAVLEYDILNWNVVMYPYHHNYDKVKADKIANSTYKNLRNMDGKKQNVAGTRSSLSNSNLVGYFSKRTDLNGYEVLNEFPDFKGFAYDITALNKYRQNGHYFVSYFLLENFTSDQEMLSTANKINSALYQGAKKYYGESLKISKNIKTKKEDYSSKYDDFQVVNYEYSGLDDQSKIRFRVYIKNKIIQYMITFSKD